jgi:acyl-CoA reductase-like NAD-dependent aldehyde dehydrogenase
LNLAAHKLSPALAVGASTVLKPAAQCPMTALRLVELMHEANLPPGAVNGLHVPPQVAQLMVEDERMRVLSFTGSAAVGWKLKSLAGQKQVCLELGGNAPVIVDDGVDIDSIMDRILMGSWAHGGQVCIKAQRIYVHEALFESFMESFVRETKALVCGDPTREDTVVGPLIDTRSRDRVMAWIQEAQAEGAHLHCGGESDGNVVAPTILTGVHSGMKVVAEEVFGPVTNVIPFSSYDQVLVEANRGPYGLQAGIFTRDVERAFQAFDALDYGGVMINDVPTFRVDNLPYGGSRSSGMGREGVRYAAEDFTEHKVLTFRRDV